MGTSPRVGLIALTPQKAAGTRNEPPVSVPVAAGTIIAARAAADPPLDPPGERSRLPGIAHLISGGAGSKLVRVSVSHQDHSGLS